MRDLLRLKSDWVPQQPLRHALYSIEGPPRLLELLLWAMQAEAPLRGDHITANVDLKKVKDKLAMTWKESAEVLRLSTSSLRHAGVIVNYQELVSLGPEARCVMNHVLLGSVLRLDQLIIQEPKQKLVNDVVMWGLAQCVANGDGYRLHCHRCTFWQCVRYGCVLETAYIHTHSADVAEARCLPCCSA